MMAPNPFSSPFNPMRNYNVGRHNYINNYNGNPQKAHPRNNFSNNGNFKNNACYNEPKNDMGSNCCTIKNDIVCDFNNENTDTNLNEPIFEIFGIKLYFDDLLIIALLFFLYKENCTDEYLFIILVILLLS